MKDMKKMKKHLAIAQETCDNKEKCELHACDRIWKVPIVKVYAKNNFFFSAGNFEMCILGVSFSMVKDKV